ncbi:N-formylglutamate amidohydrolase [bacterium]|nr:N-formylglutamate amidohydrolase [bacterium]
MPQSVDLILTCEHGGNGVPSMFGELFTLAGEHLASHRGWDPGALELARCMARSTGAPLFTSTVTRLLIDLNRSLGNPNMFSALVKDLNPAQKRELLERYYHPFRKNVQREIAVRIEAGRSVLHLSVHTFTPELDGSVRPFDIGLLYDPERSLEVAVVDLWEQELSLRSQGGWRVKRNEPYQGTMDGHVQALRQILPSSQYIGIELEVNQRYPLENGSQWLTLQHDLVKSLRGMLTCLRNER